MNRLANEKSLYLRQHAENPVDWYPWGEEALAAARSEDKPLLISIGYSACHWCHVMAHESFENPSIAKLMNAHFICVKIDREERPDLDQIYMDAVQMMNGHGGWPLNVFCLPDGRPFAGGTYFPPDESRGHQIVPWPQLLMRVSDFYRRQQQDLIENAEAIAGNMIASNRPIQGTGSSVEGKLLLATGQMLARSHDDEFGGFSEAPKFPPSMTLDHLLALRATAAVDENNPALARRYDQVINTTLTAMAHGGIFDQIGGGFARYSVDRHWLIPHFEKMLYDNALLLDIYAKASLRYDKRLYPAIMEETIQWLRREMLLEDGTYAAAIDADSEDGEGFYYTWTPAEVEAVLGKRTAVEFCEAYGITEEGTFEEGRSQPILLEHDFDKRQQLMLCREKLLQQRQQRTAPGRDDKCLLAWNSLLLRGLAQAAFACGRKDWFGGAAELAERLWEKFHRGDTRLYPVAYGDECSGNACLDDYAFYAEAILTLASRAALFGREEAGLWIERAERLVEVIRAHFHDADEGGYYFTSDDHAGLFHRKKDWFDNATPSGQSSLLHVFAMLHSITGATIYADYLAEMNSLYIGMAQKAPAAATYALSAITQNLTGHALLKVLPGTDTTELLQGLRKRPWRQVVVLVDPNLTNRYQLCVGSTCLAPVDELQECLQRM
jgi:uncharacterized protein